MSDDVKAAIAAMNERLHDLERRVGIAEGWINKAIMTLIGGGGAVLVAYLKAKGVW